jgi:hypothetical protein
MKIFESKQQILIKTIKRWLITQKFFMIWRLSSINEAQEINFLNFISMFLMKKSKTQNLKNRTG